MAIPLLALLFCRPGSERKSSLSVAYGLRSCAYNPLPPINELQTLRRSLIEELKEQGSTALSVLESPGKFPERSKAFHVLVEQLCRFIFMITRKAIAGARISTEDVKGFTHTLRELKRFNEAFTSPQGGPPVNAKHYAAGRGSEREPERALDRNIGRETSLSTTAAISQPRPYIQEDRKWYTRQEAKLMARIDRHIRPRLTRSYRVSSASSTYRDAQEMCPSPNSNWDTWISPEARAQGEPLRRHYGYLPSGIKFAPIRVPFDERNIRPFPYRAARSIPSPIDQFPPRRAGHEPYYHYKQDSPPTPRSLPHEDHSSPSYKRRYAESIYSCGPIEPEEYPQWLDMHAQQVRDELALLERNSADKANDSAPGIEALFERYRALDEHNLNRLRSSLDWSRPEDAREQYGEYLRLYSRVEAWAVKTAREHPLDSRAEFYLLEHGLDTPPSPKRRRYV
ncbi:hypothetical protein DL93DRAFT_2098259 [Clavulina sp. PMI_390]|nr:hypothetical protein DL93DRAFT_2098259 [Clavulina sp. PMI_390]